MNTYLSQSHINQIAYICNTIFSKANKTKLKELGTKYNLTFDQSKQSNMNAFWLMVTEELRKDPKAIDTMTGFNYVRNEKENNWMTCKEMILKRIVAKYKEDYNFICSFDPEQPMQEIINICRLSYIYPSLNVRELLKVDNYEKYFSLMYGIESVDKQAINNTKRISDFFDSLFKNIPNKNLDLVLEYLINQDFTELHNKLHIKE